MKIFKRNEDTQRTSLVGLYSYEVEDNLVVLYKGDTAVSRAVVYSELIYINTEKNEVDHVILPRGLPNRVLWALGLDSIGRKRDYGKYKKIVKKNWADSFLIQKEGKYDIQIIGNKPIIGWIGLKFHTEYDVRDLFHQFYMNCIETRVSVEDALLICEKYLEKDDLRAVK